MLISFSALESLFKGNDWLAKGHVFNWVHIGQHVSLIISQFLTEVKVTETILLIILAFFRRGRGFLAGFLLTSIVELDFVADFFNLFFLASRLFLGVFTFISQLWRFAWSLLWSGVLLGFLVRGIFLFVFCSFHLILTLNYLLNSIFLFLEMLFNFKNCFLKLLIFI